MALTDGVSGACVPCRRHQELQFSDGHSSSQIPELLNPLTRFQSIESIAMDGRLRIVYTGQSMNPTLRVPDLLEIEPYGVKQVRAGDVVYFKSPKDVANVVHRVIRVTPAGVRTKGDANLQKDAWTLQPAQLIGRVVAARRGSRNRQVAGDWQGLVVAWTVRLGRRIWRFVECPMRSLYAHLIRLGPFEHLLPAGQRPRLVRFRTRHRVVLKLVVGRRMIGRFDDLPGKWHVERPFRLFVDLGTLGCPPAYEEQSERPAAQQDAGPTKSGTCSR